MAGYTKLFSSILDSTVWAQPTHVRIVWVTMLAMVGHDGVVEASVPGLAKRAGVSIADAEDALACFLAPDPYSRTKDNDGRRIAEVDGGWELLNHLKYKHKASESERREKAAARAKNYRERHASSHTERDASRAVTENHASNDIRSDQIRSEEEKRAAEVAAPSVKPAKKQNPALVALKAALKRHIEVPPTLSGKPARDAASRLQSIIDAGHASDLDGAADCLVLAAIATGRAFPWCLTDAKPAPKKTSNSLNQRPGWMP